MKKNSMLENALAYLDLGFSPIPIHIFYEEDTNKKPNKKPFIDSWKEYQTQKPTEEEINRWWTKWPDAAIALLTSSSLIPRSIILSSACLLKITCMAHQVILVRTSKYLKVLMKSQIKYLKPFLNQRQRKSFLSIHNLFLV